MLVFSLKKDFRILGEFGSLHLTFKHSNLLTPQHRPNLPLQSLHNFISDFRRFLIG